MCGSSFICTHDKTKKRYDRFYFFQGFEGNAKFEFRNVSSDLLIDGDAPVNCNHQKVKWPLPQGLCLIQGGPQS